MYAEGPDRSSRWRRYRDAPRTQGSTRGSGSCATPGRCARAGAAQGVPVILSEAVSHITPSDATLEAHIDTEGVENGAWYQFQLATNTSEYAEELSCPPTGMEGGESGEGSSLCIGVGRHAGALPIGFVAGGSAGQPVSIDLAGAGTRLKPNTTYHYRVIAAKRIPTEDTTSWEPPTVFGLDQTFTTAKAHRPRK